MEKKHTYCSFNADQAVFVIYLGRMVSLPQHKSVQTYPLQVIRGSAPNIIRSDLAGSAVDDLQRLGPQGCRHASAVRSVVRAKDCRVHPGGPDIGRPVLNQPRWTLIPRPQAKQPIQAKIIQGPKGAAYHHQPRRDVRLAPRRRKGRRKRPSIPLLLVKAESPVQTGHAPR